MADSALRNELAGIDAADAGVLFTPFRLKSLTLANRTAMAPMTRYTSASGVPGPDFGAFYRRRAEGGVGLVGIGAIGVDHDSAHDDPGAPMMNAASAEAWRCAVAEVHAGGGKVSAEIWGIGMPTNARPANARPIRKFGPSGISSEGDTVGEPATVAEIESMIAAFARSAGIAKEIGFDAIDVHCAHGYMLDQFMWERTNRRTDGFGGDLVGRTRFPAAVVAACRAAVGPDYPIFLRFSQWKNADYTAKLARTPQELERLLRPLVDAGVDLFDCSSRCFWEPEFEGSDMNIAGWTKKVTGRPTITVGSVGLDIDVMQTIRPDGVTENRAVGLRNIARLFEMMSRGDFDLVALGRPLLADPDWPAKVRAGDIKGLVPFERDHLNTIRPGRV